MSTIDLTEKQYGFRREIVVFNVLIRIKALRSSESTLIVIPTTVTMGHDFHDGTLILRL